MSNDENLSSYAEEQQPKIDSSNPDVASTSDQISTSISSCSEEKKIDTTNDDVPCQNKDDLQILCNDMFSKIAIYINGEVDSTIEDYKLIEKMNIAAMGKYDSMYEMAKATGDHLHTLNQKFEDLQPYLDQIETIERNVSLLEQTAYKLDAYSKRLEERFKRLDKK